jgi:hypothetical protein
MAMASSNGRSDDFQGFGSGIELPRVTIGDDKFHSEDRGLLEGSWQPQSRFVRSR